MTAGQPLPRVTIVVATYNRPELLTEAVRSVINQTCRDWVLLAVGDACDERTGEALKALGDERIHFLNLEDRCGEQSGPNAVGMAAAKTDYIAFLNHDDIWMPSHLEKALAVLEKGEVDFYASSVGVTTFAKVEDGSRKPVFITRTPSDRTFDMVFHRNRTFFEPVSTWVMRRTLVQKVGFWRPASEIYRTPLVDWLLRAWRAGVAAHFSNETTVIYCDAEKSNVAKRSADGPVRMYDWNDGEQAYWNKVLTDEGESHVLELIESQPKRVSRVSTMFDGPAFSDHINWVFETCLNPENGRLYKEFGWDSYGVACQLTKIPKGASLNMMLKRRTGETLTPRSSWKEVVERAIGQLDRLPSWRQWRDRLGVA